MKRPRMNEDGATLLMAMLVLWIVSVLAVASLTTSGRLLSGTLTDRSRTQAIHAADAGIEYVTYRLSQTAVSGGQQTFSVDLGNRESFDAVLSATIALSELAVRRTITSTGKIGARTRKVRATLERTFDSFAIPLFAKTGVNLQGGGQIDWYDSRNGPYTGLPQAPHYGSVYSNGNIVLQGGSAIYGDARPGPPLGQTIVCHNCLVTGSTEPASQPADYPPVDPSEVESFNDNAQMCDGALCAPPSSWNASTKTLSLSGGGQVTLRSGTYNFCRLSMSGGGSRITIDPSSGPVRIFFSAPTTSPCIGVTNPIDVQGGSWSFPSSQEAWRFQMFVTGSPITPTSVTLKSGTNFLGAVYAPLSDFTIQASADMFGGFTGNSLVLTGGGDIHYDRALAGVATAGEPWTRKLWIEIL